MADGTEVLNTSASITRGFKTGYINIRTGGIGGPEYRSVSDEAGNGGSGATGGNGATVGGLSGGGGGSGYSDGSVTVVSTQQGGSTGAAKVVIRLAS